MFNIKNEIQDILNGYIDFINIRKIDKKFKFICKFFRLYFKIK